MRGLLIATLAAGSAALLAAPAQACAVHEPLNLNGIRRADLVVIGRIVGNRIGRDGVFNVAVEQVLHGRAGRTIPVRFQFPGTTLPRSRPWNRYMIALQGPGTTRPPIPFTIMQHICSDPYILEAGSARAAAARRLLPGRR